jgi:hypothetical protein
MHAKRKVLTQFFHKPSEEVQTHSSQARCGATTSTAGAKTSTANKPKQCGKALAGTQNAQTEQRCQNMPAMHSSSAGQVSLCLQQPPRNPEEKLTPPRPPLRVPALAALVKQSLQAAPTFLLLPPVLSLSFPASCCQLTQLMLQLLFAHMAPSHSAGRSHCVTPEVWLW